MWGRRGSPTQLLTSPRLPQHRPSLLQRLLKASLGSPPLLLPGMKPLRNLPKTPEQYTKKCLLRFKSSIDFRLLVSSSFLSALFCINSWMLPHKPCRAAVLFSIKLNAPIFPPLTSWYLFFLLSGFLTSSQWIMLMQSTCLRMDPWISFFL